MWEKLEQMLNVRQLNMSQLSKLSGVNKSHFTDLKRGKIKTLSFKNLVKIADALDVSLDEFRN